ncbi:hypothetical protein [Dysosmobacter sp.]|uniref:hypothetical protein n=1 Tax=Dysosmobacter sp. TaxID=2591382 RepID=UPI003AF05B05
MNLLQTLRSVVIRLNGDRNTLFDVPMARQKAILEGLPEPEDLFERAYAQYRCQMMLERPILRAGYQLAAMLLLPIYRRQLLRRPASRKDETADAVFAFGGPDTILPCSLRQEYPGIRQVRDFQNALFLTREDCSFLRELARRYPTAFYFRFKCMAKLAMYRSLYETYRPKAIIVSEEYSYTSSFLTEYCHRLGVEHINVMHGDKLYDIHDTFFCFDRCYIWDQFYRDLFCELRAEPTQFRMEMPPSMQPWDAQDVEKAVDYTYYLQAETSQMLEKIAESLQTLQKSGAVVAVRPHPLYSDMETVRRLFSDFEIEETAEVGIETSILRTRHVIGLYSTVLYQAHINHVPVVIDDLTAPERFAQLKSLRYIMLDKPHGLLSALLQEESPT